MHRIDTRTTDATRLAGWSEAHAYSEPAADQFPGLPEIIRLVDEALGARDAAAIVETLSTRLPELIARHRRSLPAEWLRIDPRGYRRRELHYCPIGGYQILAMTWGPGQGTPIHDHREVWGVESVWQGELLVGEFKPADVAGDALKLEPVHASRLRAGDVLGLTPEHGLHLCRNPSPHTTTVSLHVYAKPLDAFGIYVDEGDGWYRRHEYEPPVER